MTGAIYLGCNLNNIPPPVHFGSRNLSELIIPSERQEPILLSLLGLQVSLKILEKNTIPTIVEIELGSLGTPTQINYH